MKSFVAAFLLGTLAIMAHAATAPQPASQRATITYPAADKDSGIAFIFDKPYTCGQYANGDWWVAVDPKSKQVVITQVTPAAGDGRNGWCVNPSVQDAQPYDNRSRLKFDATQMPALPYAAHGGESIMKTASCTKPASRFVIQFAAVLTVVDQPVTDSATAFRPPYAGTDKTVFRTTALQPQLLPSLAPTAHAITREVAERRSKNVRIDYSSFFAAPDCMPAEAAPGWGTDMALYDNEVYLWLCLNQSAEVKRPTLIAMVQHGIDIYGARKSLNTQWVHGGGGNGNGRLLPFTFAATLLNSPAMKEEVKKSVADAPSGNTFWESEMFYRSPIEPHMVLWGMGGPYLSEEAYWKGISADPNVNKAGREPYGYIDGGSIPGAQYQGCTCMPVVYEALILRLIPQLQSVWPEKDIRILEYADRWVTKGVHAMPDPYAPAPKLTAQEWADRANHGYGKTWGPDPAHPGEAIKGAGRFPELQGAHVNGASLGGAERRSAFGDEMWAAYRGSAK